MQQGMKTRLPAGVNLTDLVPTMINPVQVGRDLPACLPARLATAKFATACSGFARNHPAASLVWVALALHHLHWQ